MMIDIAFVTSVYKPILIKGLLSSFSISQVAQLMKQKTQAHLFQPPNQSRSLMNGSVRRKKKIGLTAFEGLWIRISPV